jgi:hypothetical protein
MPRPKDDAAAAAADRALMSLERLRETVAVRVQATSLRAVARQVGMSPSGLEKFLGGSTPYARSRQKLHDWWLREGARPRSDLTTEGVEVAMGALLRDLPPEHRDAAMRRLVRSLVRVYAAQEAPPPPWLDELVDMWLDAAEKPASARTPPPAAEPAPSGESAPPDAVTPPDNAARSDEPPPSAPAKAPGKRARRRKRGLDRRPRRR